jgi:hypothetical protein
MTLNFGDQQPREGLGHFCRGCGFMLPPDFRGIYHKECLRADKRQRVRAQRRREQELFKIWMSKQICPECGTRYRHERSNDAAKPSCETSRPAEELGSPEAGV